MASHGSKNEKIKREESNNRIKPFLVSVLGMLDISAC